MVQSGALSEPEGECSSFSSYESLSSNSEIDEQCQEEAEEELILVKNDRRNSTSTTYSSWRLRRHSRRQSSIIKEDEEKTASKESLTVINEAQKNWWHWTRLALFMASPFIARQLGIIFGKRILSRVFKPST